MFMRQLARVGVVVSFQQKRIAVTMRSAPTMVILGDLICPLNAWSSHPPHAGANQDARILEVAVAVAEKVSACVSGTTPLFSPSWNRSVG